MKKKIKKIKKIVRIKKKPLIFNFEEDAILLSNKPKYKKLFTLLILIMAFSFVKMGVFSPTEKNLKVIITLGKIAFDNCIKLYKKNFIIKKKLIFKHGVKYRLPDNKILIPCYHPSPRNVNTKIINTKKMVNLLKMAKKII